MADVRAIAAEAFGAEGCSAPHEWSNGPGDRYAPHEHPYHKVLFCLDGSLVFHVGGHDLELRSGDRLDLPPRTVHGATVGPDGCRCIEASR
jgi:quercetin dioxygenase-like cupin family protein